MIGNLNRYLSFNPRPRKPVWIRDDRLRQRRAFAFGCNQTSSIGTVTVLRGKGVWAASFPQYTESPPSGRRYNSRLRAANLYTRVIYIRYTVF
jgi:hypothetical protein